MARSRTQKNCLRSLVCAAVPLVLAGSVSVSHAEPNPERARTLFQQAKALRSAGRYDAACVKFEQSLALDVGIGTEFNLADCWEHVNRTASAYELFLKVAEHAAA